MPPPVPIPPTVPHEKLTDLIPKPCGIDCILNPPSGLPGIWTDDDHELLSMILETSPDAPSCDIAPILKKTCRDVHKNRQYFFQDSKKHGAFPKSSKRVVDMNLVPILALAAVRQIAHALTTKLDVGALVDAVINTTEVKQSKYGLGLFILEPCKSRQLITEYVGEVVFEPTVRSRGPRAFHVGRCYVFGLAADTCLDSAQAGNEARFINHSAMPNCESRLMLVNGQHRIGIYASRPIQSGEELFINYGSEFPIEGASQQPSGLLQTKLANVNDTLNIQSHLDGESATIVGVPEPMAVDYDHLSDATYRPSIID
ncbi:hypothetical protein CVT24_011553 [Panaeolus cyanescens]|uniref:SET domain-containing protein n=1 Tax=Panaeolus cyanescens TaxID=181874 RepID=A0A409VLT5_9AGAR|nr:hypothetical protein CVT24_011553 [Panaeolus cyanescens]